MDNFDQDLGISLQNLPYSRVYKQIYQYQSQGLNTLLEKYEYGWTFLVLL